MADVTHIPKSGYIHIGCVNEISTYKSHVSAMETLYTFHSFVRAPLQMDAHEKNQQKQQHSDDCGGV